LIETQVIKTVNSDYASKFETIEHVLSSINDYGVEEEFTDRINFLSTFAIDKALCISR
jgi:UDP-3-O-acyl-N-acetylglucosamine deacetylase